MRRLIQLSAFLASVGVLGGVLLKQGERPLRSFDRPAAAPSYAGYLTAKELPDSLALLPPPPTEHSSEMLQDEAAREKRPPGARCGPVTSRQQAMRSSPFRPRPRVFRAQLAST